jgi:hypothetical protein
MIALYANLYQDPMFFIGLLFAFLAAISFLIFLRGFLSGLPALFTFSANADHQSHHRLRVTWGLMLLLFLFLYWELLKWTIAFFTGTAQSSGAFIAIALLWLILVVLPFLL